jgi:hypothetical protein
MDNIIKDRRTRKTIYRVLEALILIAGIWGFIEAEGVAQWLAILATLFGVGGNELAAKNVPANQLAE